MLIVGSPAIESLSLVLLLRVGGSTEFVYGVCCAEKGVGVYTRLLRTCFSDLES
jgi:hypothetical protein